MFLWLFCTSSVTWCLHSFESKAPSCLTGRMGCQCGRRDTQHNDTQHNDTQHNVTQHNDTQHNNK